LDVIDTNILKNSCRVGNVQNLCCHWVSKQCYQW